MLNVRLGDVCDRADQGADFADGRFVVSISVTGSAADDLDSAQTLLPHDSLASVTCAPEPSQNPGSGPGQGSADGPGEDPHSCDLDVGSRAVGGGCAHP